MENKIVVHMKSGDIHKGVTHDFAPDSETFHVLPAEGGGVPVRVRADQMKALFYVKDFFGNSDFIARRAFDDAHRAAHRAILTFDDGEEIWGVLGDLADDEAATGFYFYPADTKDNNIRIYVVRSALKEMRRVS